MFPAVEAHTEHRILVRRDGVPIVPPPPESRDLAGKYGVQAPAKDFEATLLGPNPPPGDSDQVMLSTDRSPRSESKYLVERPSSCDTGHNTRLAMKGSVQQSPVDRPVYSEHGTCSDHEHGSNRTRHHSDVSRSLWRDSNTHRNTILLRHAGPGELSPASMIRYRHARSRSRSYDSVSPRRHSRSPSLLRGKKKKSHKKRKHSSTSSSSFTA